MFTIADYVGSFAQSQDWTPERKANAERLISACAGLQSDLEAVGVKFHLNPATGTTISGTGHGGFRTQDCPIGAPESAHKQGEAVDRYDPENEIDEYLWQDFVKNGEKCLLAKHGIYCEATQATPHWSHWGIRKASSHFFKP